MLLSAKTCLCVRECEVSVASARFRRAATIELHQKGGLGAFGALGSTTSTSTSLLALTRSRVEADDARAISEFGDRAGSLRQRGGCEPL